MRAETAFLIGEESRPGHVTQSVRSALPIVSPDGAAAPSYYDIPFLKRPVWSWEIGAYFFLGGLSAGSYLLARLADRLGGSRYRVVTRAGTLVAAAALAPCPVLLIADLADPKRFHHMLRVFKPRSPMNLGSWVLAGYSGVLFLTVVREWFRASDAEEKPGLPARFLWLAVDAAGLPLALFFSGYTGVLLSATATPVWTKNPWLGPLFTASAVSNGAAATNLALELRPGAEEDEKSAKALEKIDTAAHAVEAAALTGFLAHAGELAKPLTQGPLAPCFWGAVAGLAASELLKRVPAPKGVRRWTKVAAAAFGIASGFALKWAVQHAGPPSAAEPDANRQASRS